METPRLIYSADVARVGQDARRLARLVGPGALTRVRRGAYVDSDGWKALDSRQRYGLAAEAFRFSRRCPPVFSHQSAALLWGLAVVGVPSDLHVLTSDAKGGRSRPGVRRHLAAGSPAVVRCGDLLLTDKATTVLGLILSLPFMYAVAITDSALRRTTGPNGKVNTFTPPSEPALAQTAPADWNPPGPQGEPLDVATLLAAADLLPTLAGRRRARTVIEFASPLAASAGESISRAQMHILGCPPPLLQHAFILRGGHRAFVDFYFAEQRVVGEFDGREKYVREDWADGSSTQERVLAEKDREDQIRAQGMAFVRWTWAEALDIRRFGGILRRVGIPHNGCP